MSGKTLIKGAATLGAAGLIVKLLGAAFRIPLVNWIGDTGMANYNPAYYIYNFFIILATAGIPVAISKMVSERMAVGDFAEAHRVFKLSMMLMTAIGTVSFLILFIFADPIAVLCNNPQAALAMRAISPCLIFVPLQAAYRGYFQGMQNMRPTAVSQVTEQFFRVAIGLFLAYTLFNMAAGGNLLMNFDKYERGAAGATFGATAGSVGGLLIILLIYGFSRKAIKYRIRRSQNKESERNGKILKRILMIAVPITIGASIMPLMNFLDVPIVIGRLQHAGYGYEEAKSLYGQLGGFAGSLVYFPQVLIQAVAMSLVPLVSSYYRTGDLDLMRSNVSLGLRMSCIIGFPCALGLMSLSEPIMLLLYPAQTESAISAADLLFTLSIGIVFLSVSQTLTGVLQGIGKQMIPVMNLAIGVAVKIALTWILTGIPAFNVQGAAIGTVCAFAIASILNYTAARKYTGASINKKNTFGKPLLASLIMYGAVVGIYKLLAHFISGNTLPTLIAIIAGVIIYAAMIFVTRAVTKEEITRLPKGAKLIRVFGKFLR